MSGPERYKAVLGKAMNSGPFGYRMDLDMKTARVRDRSKH